MGYEVAVDLSVRHEFWGEATPPLQFAAADPAALRRAGLVLRTGDARALIAAPSDGEGLPSRIGLDLLTGDVGLISLTQGWRAEEVPVFTAGPEAAEDGIRLTGTPESLLPRHPGDRRLCRVELALAADRFPLRAKVSCETVEALWAYHVVGKGGSDPIRIVDDAGGISFDDLGEETLPNGRRARVLRSSAPVPMRLRTPVRLRLQQDQPPPYEPEILIPVLPAGGTNLRPVPGGASVGILQSDIYVSP